LILSEKFKTKNVENIKLSLILKNKEHTKPSPIFLSRTLKIPCMIMGIIIFSTLMSGCISSKPDSSSSIQSTLRIGVMSDLGAVPFVIAQQQDYFEKRGLQVEIQVFKSAIDRDTALQTGNLDGAMVDMLTLLFYNDAGFDVKMTSQTYGNYKMITSPSLSIDSFLNLNTVSVGLSSNTVIEFATQKIAEAKDFDAKLSMVAIPQMPVRLEMLRANELNGATLPDPLASAAVLDGGSLIGSTEEYGLFPGIFVMTQTAIEQNSDGIKSLNEAYDEAVDYINQKQIEEYFDFLVEKLGFPPVLKGKFEMPTFIKTSPPDQKTFNEVSSWMQKKGLLKKQFSYESLLG